MNDDLAISLKNDRGFGAVTDMLIQMKNLGSDDVVPHGLHRNLMAE